MIHIKEFTTAVKDQAAREDGELEFGFDVEFAIRDERYAPEDGSKDVDPRYRREMVAHKPSDGQMTMFMAFVGDDLMANSEVIAFSINFLNSLLEPEDRRYLKRRLMDMADPFGAEDVADILTFVMGEWSGKAGGSQSGSARSRRATGQRSTAKRSRTA